MKSAIYIIIGPTCSGKTRLATELCQQHNGEIISADSRQIYKYMDIGTGKSGNAYGYDMVNPDDFFTAYDFAKYALKKTGELQKAGKQVFVVGGTGFYVDIYTGRIKPSLSGVDLEFRADLNTKSIDELQEMYLDLNLEKNNIDFQNRVRLIRAIEKSKVVKSVEELPYLKNADFKIFGLTGPRELLYKRADAWLDSIWNQAFFDEVLYLQRTFPKSDKISGLIYKSARDFLSGKITSTEALQRAKFDTHAYIRRQQTYFKKIPNVTWLDISSDNYKQNLYNAING